MLLLRSLLCSQLLNPNFYFHFSHSFSNLNSFFPLFLLLFLLFLHCLLLFDSLFRLLHLLFLLTSFFLSFFPSPFCDYFPSPDVSSPSPSNQSPFLLHLLISAAFFFIIFHCHQVFRSFSTFLSFKPLSSLFFAPPPSHLIRFLRIYHLLLFVPFIVTPEIIQRQLFQREGECQGEGGGVGRAFGRTIEVSGNGGWGAGDSLGLESAPAPASLRQRIVERPAPSSTTPLATPGAPPGSETSRPAARYRLARNLVLSEGRPSV